MLLDQTGDFVHEKHFSVSVAFKVFFATRIKMFMSAIHMHIHMQYTCTCMFVTLQSPHSLTQGLVISANFRKRLLGQIWNLGCNVDDCYSVIYFFVQTWPQIYPYYAFCFAHNLEQFCMTAWHWGLSMEPIPQFSILIQMMSKLFDEMQAFSPFTWYDFVSFSWFREE